MSDLASRKGRQGGQVRPLPPPRMDRLYIIVRRDLSAGLQIAQAGHALRAFAAAFPELDREWYEGGNNLVVLAVADESALGLQRDALEAAGVALAAFHEPDLGGAMTALAAAGDAKRHVRHLALAGGQPSTTCRVASSGPS